MNLLGSLYAETVFIHDDFHGKNNIRKGTSLLDNAVPTKFQMMFFAAYLPPIYKWYFSKTKLNRAWMSVKR
jgi:hypothetical protein